VQSLLRGPGASNGRQDITSKLIAVMRSGAGRVLGDLTPDELGRVQLGSGDRKVEHMQAPVSRQEVLDLGPLVDGMAVPDEHNWSSHGVQDLLEEANHIVSRQVMPM
jgi:hypothetical protein